MDLKTDLIDLRYLTVMITEQCNLECDYCYVKKSPCVMSKQNINKSLELADNLPGPENIIVSPIGGEIFLYPDLLELMFNKASNMKKKAVFKLCTNGTVFNKRTESLLRKNSDKIVTLAISMDGYKEIHDKHRFFKNRKGSWDVIMRNLERFKSIIPFIIISLRFTHNEVMLKKRISNLYNLGFRYFSFSPVTQSVDKMNYSILKKELFALADWYADLILNGENIFIINFREVLKEAVLTQKKGCCQAGKFMLDIDINGDIYPCTQYRTAKINSIGSLENFNINKLRLFNFLSTPQPKDKKYFLCPLYRLHGFKYDNFTNDINKLPVCNTCVLEVGEYLLRKVGKNRLRNSFKQAHDIFWNERFWC